MAVFRLMSSRESLSGHQFTRHTSSVSGSTYNRWKCVWTSCARGSGQEALRAAVAEWRQTEDKPSFHRAEAAYKINTAGRAFSVMNEPEQPLLRWKNTVSVWIHKPARIKSSREKHMRSEDSIMSGLEVTSDQRSGPRSWRTRVKRLLEPEKKQGGSWEVGHEFWFIGIYNASFTRKNMNNLGEKISKMMVWKNYLIGILNLKKQTNKKTVQSRKKGKNNF